MQLSIHLNIHEWGKIMSHFPDPALFVPTFLILTASGKSLVSDFMIQFIPQEGVQVDITVWCCPVHQAAEAMSNLCQYQPLPEEDTDGQEIC